MTKKTWQIKLEDGEHVVELDHGFFSGKRIIQVDGKTVLDSSELQHLVFDTGGVHEFNINSHPCAVVIRTNGITFNYDFAVDGRSTTSGQPIDSIKPLPAWIWVLIVCGLSLCICVATTVFLLLMIQS
jgi:hypothetical protein